MVFLSRLQSAWKRTDDLFALLKPEALIAQPIVWRHPFIFYAGHLPAFAWNQICGSLNRLSFNPYFDEIFCRGIDPDIDTGNCHPHPDVPEDWPDLADILAYGDSVRGAVLETLADAGSANGKNGARPNSRLFSIVLEHEMMHQETQLYMAQELPLELKARPEELAYSFRGGEKAEEIKVPSGRATLGAPSARVEFGWDNEFQEQTVEVGSFTMDSTPVTNGQFFDFVESGAHEDPRHWSKEDWAWKSKEKLRHPNFWREIDGAWFYRGLFDLLPLESVSAWPVYVSLAAARAYARWKEKRLPTEAEYNRAAFGKPDGGEASFPWGENAPSSESGNLTLLIGRRRRWDRTERGKRLGRARAGRQRLGVDRDAVRAVSRICPA